MRKIKAYLYSFVFAASLLCGYGKTKAADAASVDEEIIASVTDAEPDSDSDSEAEAGDNADIREQTNYRENYGHIDVDFDIVSSDDSDDSYEDFLVYASYIPSSYDSRDYGYVTSVKNQGSYGTCWAFSALSAGESSLLSQDIMTDVDLSEAHFIYFLYNNVDDPLGNLGEDKNIITDSSTDFMEIGGSDLYNMFALSAWKGAADESVAPYDYANPLMSLDKSLAYEDIAHLQNVNIVSMEDSDKVKSLIMKYGAVSCGMYLQNNIYYNSINKAFYQNTSSSSNHDVNIIGWDDTYSRDNFSSYKRPSSDGAWLIKNSWGTSMDYIWVSYEDSVLSESTAFAFIFESADNYDYNYQYDGSSSAKYLNVSNGTTFANVYEIKGSEAERLDAVAFSSRNENLKYEIQIFKNPKEGLPCSGEAVLSEPQVGVAEFAGYHTIKLDEPVVLNKGDKFTVAIKLSNADSSTSNVSMYCDGSMTTSSLAFVSDTEPGMSYYSKNGVYLDLYDISTNNLCFRIKAFTNEVPCETEITGINVVDKTDSLALSALYHSDDKDIDFKWQIYDLQTKEWSVLQDWSKKDSAVWKPKTGGYWIYAEAKDSAGNYSSYCYGYSSTKDYNVTGTIRINGICTALLADGLGVGAAFESDDSNMKFRWQEYDLSTKKWRVVSDWSSSNWAIWNPAKGSYWIYVEARNSSGKIETYVQGYVSEYDYQKPYVKLTGFCFMTPGSSIPVGVGYETNRGDVMFRWQEYDLSTKKWSVVSDWSYGNWIDWKPKKGSYWLYAEARTPDGAVSSFCWGYVSDKNYK